MELIIFDDSFELNNLESMKIKQFNKPFVSTIGMFDGVHLAHRDLLSEVKKESEIKGYYSSAITFLIHPDYILNKRSNQGYLLKFEDKVEKIASCGIDYLFVFPFSKEFSLITYEKFNEIMKKLNIKDLVLGPDTKYGYNQEGNIETLKKDFDVKIIEEVKYNNLIIHSKEVRKLLENGKVEDANKLLGYNFFIKGNVTKGNKIGRTINFRTANIDLDNNYDYLADGVYGTTISIDDKIYYGICNIGCNPTINNNITKRLEVNIFDFDEDIYGKEIKVSFLTFIRGEVKFASTDELKGQIEEDIIKFKNCLGGRK